MRHRDSELSVSQRVSFHRYETSCLAELVDYARTVFGTDETEISGDPCDAMPSGTDGPPCAEFRLDARVERSRAAVLAAGIDVLTTEGWDAVTHLRLAEAAGVGRATIYRHWPTVEDLVQDVIGACISDRQAEVVPTGDLHRDLVAELHVFVDALQQDRLHEVLVTLVERSLHSERIAEMRRELITTGRQAVWDIIDEAVADGRLPLTLTPVVAASHLAGPVLYRRLFVGETLTSDDVEEIVAAFLRAHPGT